MAGCDGPAGSTTATDLPTTSAAPTTTARTRRSDTAARSDRPTTAATSTLTGELAATPDGSFRRNPSYPLSEDSFRWTAELLERASDSRPPELELVLQNTAAAEIWLNFSATPPFSSPVLAGEDAESTLFLYHPEMGPMTAPDERIEGCWQVEDPAQARVVRIPLTIVHLDPGDTVSERYTLFAHPDNEPCFPAGTYRATHGASLRLAENVRMDLGLSVTAVDDRIESVGTEGPVIPL